MDRLNFLTLGTSMKLYHKAKMEVKLSDRTRVNYLNSKYVFARSF